MALAKHDTQLQQKEIRNEAKTPAQAVRFPTISTILLVLSFIGMMISLWMIFIYAPTDAVEGNPQRIFYFHVPTAIWGMCAFGIMALGGIMYLWKKDERWDWTARAAAEVGVVFLTFTLITGSIWGRTTWGTWWTWDARLTTCLILWFIYIAYIMMRSYMGRTFASARAGAVLAIIGLVDVPIVYESVNWWRTLHPQAVLPIGGSPQMPEPMFLTFLVAFATITLLFSFLMIQVYNLQKMQTTAQRMRAELELD
jgi:heme exporter protein C